MKFSFFFFLLITTSLFGQVAVTENEPSALVEGIVNIITGDLYVEHARNFFTGPREQLLTKVRPNGEFLLYDIQSNTFGAFTQDGVPKTMFKPEKGIVYWETRN